MMDVSSVKKAGGRKSLKNGPHRHPNGKGSNDPTRQTYRALQQGFERALRISKTKGDKIGGTATQSKTKVHVLKTWGTITEIIAPFADRENWF